MINLFDRRRFGIRYRQAVDGVWGLQNIVYHIQHVGSLYVDIVEVGTTALLTRSGIQDDTHHRWHDSGIKRFGTP